MTNEVTLKMSLPRIPDIELVAIEGLDRLARFMGIADEKIGEAKILVAEAVVNALEHAGEKDPSVRVEFALTTKELVIFVQDFGKGFDPASIERPDILKKLGTKNKRGWGLQLMKSLSDDFHIESGDGGTTITIKKLLK